MSIMVISYYNNILFCFYFHFYFYFLSCIILFLMILFVHTREKNMLIEKYDFYSPSNIKLKDLDNSLKSSLTVMNKLDDMTKQHSENVSNLVTRICQYMRCNSQFTIHCMIAAYIHDLGKIFIPKEILSKNGRWLLVY